VTVNQATPLSRAGWQLLRDTLRRQRRGLMVGVVVGLIYTAGKIAVPKVTQIAIDRGIVKGSGRS
jgi:hypothetical protein